MSPSPLDPYDTAKPLTRPKKAVPAPGASAPAIATPAAAVMSSTLLRPTTVAPAAPQAPAARQAFDAIAKTSDAIKAPYIGTADLANRALVGARNFVREGLGKSPVRPMEFNYSGTQDRLAAARADNNPATPLKPTPTPTTKPAVAAPSLRFAGIDEAPEGLYRNPQAPQNPAPNPLSAPSTFRTGDGRNGVLPAGVSMKMGANGVPEFSATGQSVVDATAALGNRTQPGVSTQAFGTLGGTPTSQSFGSINTNAASIARPGAASTLGMSVLDPRLDDQIERPTLPNAVTGSLRGPDQMGEHFRSVEDREARKKLLSDQDSRRFALELIEQHGGRRGRVATEALASLAGAQAGLVASGEKLSADAIQGRAGRDNVLANTGLEQAGADRRGDLSFQAAQMGDATENRRIAVSAIERPTLERDADGNIISIAAGRSTNVVDANGQPVRGMVQGREPQLSPDAVLKSFDSQERTLQDALYNALPEAKPGIQERIDALSAQRAALLTGGATRVTTVAQVDALPKGARYLAPDGRIYTKP